MFTESECTNAAMLEGRRKAYTSPQLNTPTAFPAGGLVGFSLYDLNTGPGGECAETLTISGYDYYKTPLRPESDNPISSSITFDSATDTFAGTLPGLTTPTDPNSLSDADASQGIQFFFSSSNGFIDASFTSLAWAAPARILRTSTLRAARRFARRRRRCRHTRRRHLGARAALQQSATPTRFQAAAI